jgi:hypothetical protein
MNLIKNGFAAAQAAPFAQDAEAAALCLIIEDFDRFSLPAVTGLRQDHFHDTANRELWKLIADRVMRSRRVDPVLIREDINSKKPQGLTISQFSDILLTEYSAESWDEYIEILNDRATRRKSEPKEPAVSETEARFLSLVSKSRVSMAPYSTMDPHEARSLLPRELWQGVLREGTLAILGGESKAKKSWFSLSMAMAAVAKRDFLGLAISESVDTPRRVRILDFELLEGNIMSRFVSMSERYETEEDHRAIWGRIEIFHHRELMIEAADWIGYACHHCDQMQRGDMLVVDCLQALDFGDSNDPSAVRKALGRLQAAATRSGVCVLIVDHFNKSTEARGMNRISGSIAKAATPDAILLLESDGPHIKLSFTLRMDPPRDAITMAFDSPSEGFRVVTDDERQERKDAAQDARKDERLGKMFPERGRQYSKAEIGVNIGRTEKTVESWLKEFPDLVEIHPGAGRSPNLYSLKS